LIPSIQEKFRIKAFRKNNSFIIIIFILLLIILIVCGRSLVDRWSVAGQLLVAGLVAGLVGLLFWVLIIVVFANSYDAKTAGRYNRYFLGGLQLGEARSDVSFA